MYLLFSRLAIGGDHSSFTLAVHLGGCSDTLFYPTRHLSKKATRKTYYLHSYPVSVVSLSLSCALFAPVSFFFYIPNIAHKSGRVSAGGNLKQSTGGAFFFFNRCSWIQLTPPLLWDGGGFLKPQCLSFCRLRSSSSCLLEAFEIKPYITFEFMFSTTLSFLIAINVLTIHLSLNCTFQCLICVLMSHKKGTWVVQMPLVWPVFPTKCLCV